MAGSNGFTRTQFPQEYGFEETVSAPGEVMVSIVYGNDSTISLYRDGELYGSYSKGGLQPFDANALVQIGPRHGLHPDVFAGQINEARIYSGALTETDLSAIFQEGPSTVPNPPAPEPPAPTLVHLWTFDGTTDDMIGTAHGELNNGATLTDDGRLSLEAASNQFFRTAPIDEAIGEKTLLAWVSLHDLDSPLSGSALTLQDPTGADVFDGIVYGERIPGQWMAGSNGFQRTPEDNFGELETVTEPGEVMVAITYEADGTIAIYRDGELYGEYTTSAPPTYRAGVANILIGPRHDDRIAAGGPDHFLDGFINEARVYNRVLSVEEIQAVFALGTSATGDFNGDGSIDVMDIDLLSSKVREGAAGGAFDVNRDGAVTSSDREFWVAQVKGTYFGDANMDGEFSSSDLVFVFQAGQYEDAIAGNSGWATGDWNGDGDFSSADFVIAFQQGGYEQGPRGAVLAVPEPATVAPLMLGVAMWQSLRRRRVR
jgi:hypothetical protein